MSIRAKTILILVPLFVSVLILTGVVSALTARSGLIRMAIESFSFKANQFETFIREQWELLEENDLTQQESFLLSFQDSLQKQATLLLINKGEIILGIDNQTDKLLFSTDKDSETLISEEDVASIKSAITSQVQRNNAITGDAPLTESVALLIQPRAWLNDTFLLNGTKYQGYYFYFAPRDMVIVVAITRQNFLQSVTEIIYITIGLIVFTVIISTIIIVLFSRSLISPLQSMIKSMQNIIKSNQLDERVEIQYQDEIGELSQTFNVMIEALDTAYKKIKQYAFSAVLAKKNETQIRNIFQKYVPANVINTLFEDPSRLLTGENRHLSLMFTDIRSFTSISETYKPDMLVKVLNSYFEKMVDVIIAHDGIIDKYIGDAIMAFFGAPVEMENSPLAAVNAAKEMIVELDKFNAELENKKLPKFITGIGINYGLVTVGNIGSEKKMDYTAIGDAVNLGSRLEGLTKQYKINLIFSSSVYENIHEKIPCRMIDTVQVKGKSSGERIYTSTPYTNEKILDMYHTHNQGIALYLNRDFRKAIKKFSLVQKMFPQDKLASLYLQRADIYIKNPPDESWNGTFVMTTK